MFKFWKKALSKTTKETRHESYINTNTTPRQKEILQALGISRMTARQIAYKLEYDDLNAVKPRLSELLKMGVIEDTGKAYDTTTHRNVTVYRRA